MALFKSQLVTQASGSVGGTTYSHTGSGLYMRARSIPVNPNSGYQLQVRSSLTELVMKWLDTLTAAQRNAWNLWAKNTPFTNALGDSFSISGQNAYIGANTGRLQAIAKLTATIARVDDAPTVFDRGDFTTPVPVFSEATGLVTSFTTGDDWVSEDEAAMLIFEGRPHNPSRNFFKGPFRLVDIIEGDSGSPPTSPKTTSAANIASRGYVFAEGQNCWAKYVVVRADGRYSSGRVVGPIAAAA